MGYDVPQELISQVLLITSGHSAPKIMDDFLLWCWMSCHWRFNRLICVKKTNSSSAVFTDLYTWVLTVNVLFKKHWETKSLCFIFHYLTLAAGWFLCHLSSCGCFVHATGASAEKAVMRKNDRLKHVGLSINRGYPQSSSISRWNFPL